MMKIMLKTWSDVDFFAGRCYNRLVKRQKFHNDDRKDDKNET